MEALFDYHTHSRFCDGKGKLGEYARRAMELGFAQIGFSAHAPMPLASGWHMKARDLPAYLREARAIAGRFAGAIEVLVGLEADYLPGVCSPRSLRAEEPTLDYVIGGVHYAGSLADGTPWTVDGPASEFEQGVREGFGGDWRRAVERYYELVGLMAREDRPDIIAHFDLVKKNNRGHFDEEADWYVDAVRAALDVICESGCVMELNTGGVLRGYRADFYPSAWILREMARRRMPVTLGSDAHRAEDVGGHFAAALDLLAACGYTECWRRLDGRWQPVRLGQLAGRRAR